MKNDPTDVDSAIGRWQKPAKPVEPDECGNTPYDEGPFTLVQPVQKPLTDGEIARAAKLADLWPAMSHSPELFAKFVRAIERAHGIWEPKP